jgi:hypothetical protein
VPYLDNYWSDSFGPKCDPPVFGVLHLPKYFFVIYQILFLTLFQISKNVGHRPWQHYFQDDDPCIKVPQIKVEVKEEGKDIYFPIEGSSSDDRMEGMGFRTITDSTHIVYELMD